MSTTAALPASSRRPAVRSVWIAALVAALVAFSLARVDAASAASVGNLAAARADDGAYVVSETPIDAQMLDLTISSPALQGTGMVRIILPHDWYTEPNATWPTLYMINGSGDPETYQSWTHYTNIESFMAPKDVLTAMPTDGEAGYSSSEIDGGPNYEIFQAVEVPQILQRAYRSSGRNAIGGLSSSGLGAMDLAAEHPGEYRAVASTAACSTASFPGAARHRGRPGTAGESPWALWGSPILNYGTWAAHNPRVLVSKLRGVALFVSCGNGCRARSTRTPP